MKDYTYIHSKIEAQMFQIFHVTQQSFELAEIKFFTTNIKKWQTTTKFQILSLTFLLIVGGILAGVGLSLLPNLPPEVIKEDIQPFLVFIIIFVLRRFHQK